MKTLAHLFLISQCALVASATNWNKVFSHDTSGGLFADGPDALSKKPTDPEAKLFSILDQLSTMRLDDGTFHLKLCFPGITDRNPPCNEWTQASNPANSTTILDFRPIHLVFPLASTGKNFSGLGVNTDWAGQQNTLIDDYPEHPNWHCAIGARSFWPAGTNTIPGPYDSAIKGVGKVELYAGKLGKLDGAAA